MAEYHKQNAVLKKVVPLLCIISEQNLPYEDVLWKCKGKCFDIHNPENSVTPHVRFTFPSYTQWLICRKCGSSVIYDNESDAKKGMLPSELEIQSRKNYDDFNEKVRKAVEADRRESSKRYKRGKKNGK